MKIDIQAAKLAVTKDSDLIVSGNSDYTIKIWEK
jgi:hypothetical protein